MYKITEVQGRKFTCNLHNGKPFTVLARETMELSNTLVEKSPEILSAEKRGLILLTFVDDNVTKKTNKGGKK